MPLFELVGGPGFAASEIGDLLSVPDIWHERELVLVDYRGTGGSNPLECDPPGAPESMQTYVREVFPVSQVGRCREELGDKADLTQYTTHHIVEDLRQVQDAFGYDKISIFGSSYGTRVGLEYLRRYPERVAFAVLSGVVPPGLYSPRHFASNAQEALDLLVQACGADSSCHKTFPTLGEELEEVLTRVEKAPLTATAVNPLTGTSETLTIDYPSFAAGFRYLLYGSAASSRVPWMIHRASQNDWTPLLSAVAGVQMRLHLFAYFGQFWSVDCAEGPPFIDVEAEREEAAGTWFGETRLAAQLAACEGWPRGRVPEDFHDPVRADVPVILISGGADPVTPPLFGKRVAASLPNSVHLVLEGADHVGMFALEECARPAMRALWNGDGIDGIDRTRQNRTFERPPFFLGE